MSLFQFIKSHVPILDVVREYVNLRQTGHYWKGGCPFHSETEASFTVSPDKQIFYCFGCNAGGDVIAFVAKAEHLTQIEAARHLIDQHQLEIPAELNQSALVISKSEFEKRDTHFRLCEVVADWANKHLGAAPRALKYLHERLIDEKQIAYFKLGYFPGGVRETNRFIKDMIAHNILLADLLEAGIVHEGRSVLYSPFEERILFPIRDALGRYCGFGGRIYKMRDQRAKYYNSKESTYFAKGELLFGFAMAKKAIQKAQAAFLVEGYTDCIAMVANGYPNTVATLGTSCTIEHLKTLARHMNTLYVLYDGDAAGRKAIIRLAQRSWEVNLEFKVVSLPQREDPASFLQNGGDLSEYVARARDIFAFFVAILGEGFLAKPLSDKLEVSKRLVELIARLSDHFKQDILLQQASAVMQMPFSSLKELLESTKESLSRPAFWRQEPSEEESTTSEEQKADPEGLEGAPDLEKKILFAILKTVDSENAVGLELDLIPYFSKQVQLLLYKVREICVRKQRGARFSAFFDQLDATKQCWISCYCLQGDQEVSSVMFDQLIVQFCKQKWKLMVHDIKVALCEAQQQQDATRAKELMKRFLGLQQEMKRKGLV